MKTPLFQRVLDMIRVESQLVEPMFDPQLEGSDEYKANIRLLGKRIVILDGVISEELAESLIMKLLYLDSIDNSPIYLFIGSMGGTVTSGLAIYDTIKLISSNVYGKVICSACSIGSVIFMSCCKGHRYIGSTSVLSLCMPSTDSNTNIKEEAEIQKEELLKMKTKLISIIEKESDLSLNQISQFFEVEEVFNASDSINNGFADNVFNLPSTKNS